MSAADAIALARSSGLTLAVDGDRLEYEAPSPPSPSVLEALRLHKAEVIELLHAERRAIVRYVNDHFQSSPPGRCACCGDARCSADPFVTIFCGTDRAELHASCHPAWAALQESQARIVLGIDPPGREDAPSAKAAATAPQERIKP